MHMEYVVFSFFICAPCHDISFSTIEDLSWWSCCPVVSVDVVHFFFPRTIFAFVPVQNILLHCCVMPTSPLQHKQKNLCRPSARVVNKRWIVSDKV